MGLTVTAIGPMTATSVPAEAAAIAEIAARREGGGD